MFRTRRERHLWTAAAVYFAAILSTLSTAQQLLLALRERGLLRGTVLAVFLAAALALVVAVVVGRPGWRESLVVLGLGLAYVLLLGRMEMHQERLHILEYGVLALLVLAALEEHRGAPALSPPLYGRAPLLAFLVTALAGLVDELIQGIMPSRVGDPRDVAFNAFAGALALAALAARRAARSRDRASRAAASPSPAP